MTLCGARRYGVITLCHDPYEGSRRDYYPQSVGSTLAEGAYYEGVGLEGDEEWVDAVGYIRGDSPLARYRKQEQKTRTEKGMRTNKALHVPGEDREELRPYYNGMGR